MPLNRVLKKIVFTVLLLPIVVIIGSFFLPPDYHVQRSLLIKATPQTIFPYLNDLRRWPDWTAWNTNREPSLVYMPSSPSSGVGAVQSWTAKSGSGSIKLTASDPNEGVDYELNFNEGRFISTGQIRFVVKPDGTLVVWRSNGKLGGNPVARYLGLLMDKWMGSDFEIGLQNLRVKAEKDETPKTLAP